MNLKEIAAIAGVSVSTVSRVVNNQNTKCASQEVQNKIWSAVRSLGYTPNPYAQSLKRADLENSTRSFHNSIAYCCATLSSYGGHYDWELLSLIEKEILANHYAVSALHPDSDTDAGEKGSKDLGLILIGEDSDRHIAQYAARYKNIVCISGRRPQYPCDLILLDTHRALRHAIQYLQSLGHMQVSFVGTGKGPFFEGAQLFGSSKNDTRLSFFPCGLSMNSGLQLGASLCDLPQLPSCLLCENNAIACGVIQAIQENGFSVPEDISVVSLDGGLSLSRAALPVRVTTFYYNKTDISRLAIRLLIDRIHRRHSIPVICEPECHLEINGSCAAPVRR